MVRQALGRRRPAVALVAIALLGAAACAVSNGPATGDEPVLTSVSPADAQSLIGQHSGDPQFVILDVRTPAEYAGGRIAGAINIDYLDSSFASRLAVLDTGATYLVYCQSGHRSGLATQMMQKAGFRRIYDLEGGYAA
jgi:phage shock protein E